MKENSKMIHAILPNKNKTSFYVAISVVIMIVLYCTYYYHADNAFISEGYQNDHWRYKAHIGGDYWTETILSLNATKFNEIIQDNLDYKLKKPFPHLVRDNVFPTNILKAAIEEIVDNPTLNAKGCVLGSSSCFNKADQASIQNNKNGFEDAFHMGPATTALFAVLKSSTFIIFLEKLTGISDLIADPHFKGSGIHQTLPGGRLEVHADFNRYVTYNLHRRVNVFIYLNPDWEDSYGGHLELWSRDLKSCEQRILPTLGRLVVFSSTDFSYHGHSSPLTCPSNRSRRSVAMYYYTKDRPSSECISNNCHHDHTTLWQNTSCSTCEDQRCKAY